MADVLRTGKFVLFWGGWPSQWHRSSFVIDGIAYNCGEQFMMAEKARVFGDAALARILRAASPREQKALGRRVRGFDEDQWNRVCRGIVYTGNLAKFSQNDGLLKKLLATGERTIVEASPTDRIWGIGLSQTDFRAQDPAQWQGTNWLGIALMQVRETLHPGDAGAAGEIDAELQRQLDERLAIATAG